MEGGGAVLVGWPRGWEGFSWRVEGVKLVGGDFKVVELGGKVKGYLQGRERVSGMMMWPRKGEWGRWRSAGEGGGVVG